MANIFCPVSTGDNQKMDNTLVSLRQEKKVICCIVHSIGYCFPLNHIIPTIFSWAPQTIISVV